MKYFERDDFEQLDDLERGMLIKKGGGSLWETHEVAKALGVSTRTIHHWIKCEDMPVSVKGGKGKPTLFRSAEVLFWYGLREAKRTHGEIPKEVFLWNERHSFFYDLVQTNKKLVQTQKELLKTQKELKKIQVAQDLNTNKFEKNIKE
jgi:phage terminase Nu1 subunit (DNA packaging protein)